MILPSFLGYPGKLVLSNKIIEIPELIPDITAISGVFSDMVNYQRLLQLSDKRSLFLFGARNTGKSTLIEKQYSLRHTITIDLLDVKECARFQSDPDELRHTKHPRHSQSFEKSN